MLQLILFSALAFSTDPNWSEATPYPAGGISNPYQVSDHQLEQVVRAGRIHALKYPVEISGLLIPYKPVKQFVDSDDRGIFRKFIEKMFHAFSRIESFDELMEWAGLHTYPDEEGTGPYFVPYPDGMKPEFRMGESIFETQLGTAWTVSCAECHSSNLFGKKVIGLQNRFPRANEFFLNGIRGLRAATPSFFKMATGATAGEKELFKESRSNAKFIESKKPIVLGLDTSLAHVAMSLSRRALDEHSTKDPKIARNPRNEPLRNVVSESKPGVWWNVKYKNRWLLDGSVVSGNPIFTNLLWNEIGRGTDLHLLEQWLEQNTQTIAELTTAVFSSEAPHISDFFDPAQFDLQSARRGEVLFNNACAKCHGFYEKNWDVSPKTTQVIYHKQTPVIDVGTDPNRHQAMQSLLQLNDLSISKKNGILIKKQKGYVPPPLVGIWARWPYFHNNSAPNLCAVLTRSEDRPKTYWAGEANNSETDFDLDCNGYPTADVPVEWMENKQALYDTKKEGLSNSGHDKGIFIKDGIEIFSSSDKKDLIKFLQTL